MAQNIMMQVSRRLSPAARVTRAVSSADFLASRSVTAIAANVNTIGSPLRYASAFRPLIGIAGRFVPLIAGAIVVYELYQMYNIFRRQGWADNGWTLDTYCGSPDEITGVPDTINAISCGVGRVYFTATDWASYLGMPLNSGGYYHLRGYNEVHDPDFMFPTLVSAKQAAYWYKPSVGVPDPAPLPEYENVVTYLPRIPNWQKPILWGIDPASQPVIAPPGFPTPPPLGVNQGRRQNPYRAKEYQYEGQYTLPNAPKFIPAHDPVGVLDRISPPVVVGATSLTQTQAGWPQKHALARPPKFTKEKKVRIRGYKLVTGIIGHATESADFVNAIYDALDDKFKDKRLGEKFNEAKKLRILYAHWQHVDPVKAAKNLIVNEIQDRVIGYFGKQSKELSISQRPHGNLPIGYQFGKAL